MHLQRRVHLVTVCERGVPSRSRVVRMPAVLLVMWVWGGRRVRFRQAVRGGGGMRRGEVFCWAVITVRS
jgi:hypothetical protein